MPSNRWSYPKIVVVGIGSSENSEGVGIGPNSPRKPTVSAGDVDGQRPIGSGDASSCKVDEVVAVVVRTPAISTPVGPN